MVKPLEVGDRVPPVSLSDQDGALFSSADALAKGPLVVFFYPKDDTRVCTKEACAFRDARADFAAVRARDIDALMALYAEDATFTLPNGTSFTGKDTIRGVHQRVFDSGSPFPSPGARFVGAEGIAVEIEAQLPDGSVRNTTNHYRFDETGKILSLGVYARG